MIIATDQRRMALGVIMRRYNYFAVARLYNKTIAIVSNTPINLPERGFIDIVEQSKIPMHRVMMNMQMGRPYKTVDTNLRRASYSLIDYSNMGQNMSIQIYEVVSY